LEAAGAEQMALLHCVSIYPTRVETINLRNIIGLRKEFPAYPIGFSDHTEGDAAAVAAVALGAALIEKHLTLDHTKVGMDNGMATEPEPFAALVEKCRMVQQGMGTEERIVYPEELEQRRKMRRSVVTACDLPAGHVLTRADLCAKRPGTGIPPDRIGALVGMTLRHAVVGDTVLEQGDILEDITL
jgi:possible N-acylneuraminate-9-phosphate synthase